MGASQLSPQLNIMLHWFGICRPNTSPQSPPVAAQYFLHSHATWSSTSHVIRPSSAFVPCPLYLVVFINMEEIGLILSCEYAVGSQDELVWNWSWIYWSLSSGSSNQQNIQITGQYLTVLLGIPVQNYSCYHTFNQISRYGHCIWIHLSTMLNCFSDLKPTCQL